MENLVYSSAVLTLSQTTEFARCKAIDTIILHLIVSKDLKNFTIRELYESINSEFPIRIEEITKSLKRSEENCYIEISSGSKHNINDARFDISQILVNKIEEQKVMIDSFLSDSVDELFFDYVNEDNRTIIENLLLDTVSSLMSRYGYAYAGQLAGIGDATAFVPAKELQAICDDTIKKYDVSIPPTDLADSISALFDRRDPCLNNLAFSICNKYYQSRLLGLDLPIDFLSQNIYKGSVIYLDTNFIMTIAFSKSKRHNEFREILKNSDKLEIQFAATELTIAEIHARVQDYMEDLDLGEEIIPEELLHEVRENIIQTSHNKAKKESTDVKDSENAKRLSEMGVMFIEYQNGDDLFDKAELDEITKEIEEYDRKYRKLYPAKDERALFHDAYHYFLVNNNRKDGDETSAWFLTMDHSIIEHGAYRREEGAPPYSIRLLSILQTISPFIESQALKGEFADLFSELIAKDLLPQEQLFSYEDLKLLIGFDIKAKEIPPEFVRKATFHIKKNILKGGGLTEENKAEVIHEYTKFFSTPDKNFIELQRKYDRKLKDRDEDIKTKDAEIDQLKTEISSKERDLDDTTDSLNVKIKKLKHLILVILLFTSGISLSLVLWFNKFSFYATWLEKFQRPVFFNISVQLFIISTMLYFIFPSKKKWILIAGALTTLGFIIRSLA